MTEAWYDRGLRLKLSFHLSETANQPFFSLQKMENPSSAHPREVDTSHFHTVNVTKNKTIPLSTYFMQ